MWLEWMERTLGPRPAAERREPTVLVRREISSRNDRLAPTFSGEAEPDDGVTGVVCAELAACHD